MQRQCLERLEQLVFFLKVAQDSLSPKLETIGECVGRGLARLKGREGHPEDVEVLGLAQVHAHLARLLVDLPHQWNLDALLRIVLLVDADGINPQHADLGIKPQSSKGRIDTLVNAEFMSRQDHSSGNPHLAPGV